MFADTKADMAVDNHRPVVAGRDQVLAAFARKTPPQPATPQPRPPERRVERQARPVESEMTEEGYDEIVAGWVAGNLAWARKWGPPPGEAGCRVPIAVLKRNRLA
jgi:hypothetical protein